MRISSIRLSLRPELYVLGSKQVKYATSEQIISQNNGNGRSNKYLMDWPQEKKKKKKSSRSQTYWSSCLQPCDPETRQASKHTEATVCHSQCSISQSFRKHNHKTNQLLTRSIFPTDDQTSCQKKLQSNLLTFINIKLQSLLPLTENLPEDLRYQFPRAAALQRSF